MAVDHGARGPRGLRSGVIWARRVPADVRSILSVRADLAEA